MATLKPEELLKQMERAASEFETANRIIRELDLEKTERKAKTTIVIEAKRADLLTNENLKAHLMVCFSDPKFKPTLDFIANAIYLEHMEFLTAYNTASLVAKQAEKEYDMWQKQLMWHQSALKREGLELMALGSQK